MITSEDGVVFLVLVEKDTQGGLFVSLDRAAATRLAERLLDAVAKLPPPRKDGL